MIIKIDFLRWTLALILLHTLLTLQSGSAAGPVKPMFAYQP
jgi:hypothetical protein